MVKDLSYINDLPSEAQEEAVRKAVEKQCVLAIEQYLRELADTMKANNIESLNVPTIDAMVEAMGERLAAFDDPN